MPLLKCPDCSDLFSDQATSCPTCGRPITPELVSEIKEKDRLRNKQKAEQRAAAQQAAKRLTTVISVIAAVGSAVTLIISVCVILKAEATIQWYDEQAARYLAVERQVEEQHKQEFDAIAHEKEQNTSFKGMNPGVADMIATDELSKLSTKIQNEVDSRVGIVFGNSNSAKEQKVEYTVMAWICGSTFAVSCLWLLSTMKSGFSGMNGLKKSRSTNKEYVD